MKEASQIRIGEIKPIEVEEQYHFMREQGLEKIEKGDLVDVVYISSWNCASPRQRKFEKIRVIVAHTPTKYHGRYEGCFGGWMDKSSRTYDDEFRIAYHSVIEVKKVEPTLFE